MHKAMLEGASDAPERLAAILVPAVVSRLHHRPGGRHEAPDHTSDAATEAVMWYLQHPTKYNCALSRLDVFLENVAHRRLIEARRRMAAIGRRERVVDYATLARLSDQKPRPVNACEKDVERLEQQDRIMAAAQSAQEARFLEAALVENEAPAVAASMCGAEAPGCKQRELEHAMLQRLRIREVRKVRRTWQNLFQDGPGGANR